MFKKWATDETDLSDEQGYLAPIEGKIPSCHCKAQSNLRGLE